MTAADRTEDGPDVLLISGSGPYADDWHDFPATSSRMAELVASLGYSVDLTDRVDDALRRPRGRLLIVNIGRPSQPRPDDVVAAAEFGLAEHLAVGGAVLGLHSSITSMTTMPAWRRILGGAWIAGRSMHPPKSQAVVLSSGVAHPITADLTRFAVDDERYSYLQTEPDIQILYGHEHDGLWHPLIWVREHDGSRVVYHGLGHDVGSYDSPDHRAVLRRSVAWLLEARHPRLHVQRRTR